MKRYEGVRQGYAVTVTVDGRRLNPRRDLWNHSPTGFEWGYGGSGPAQLALAILADHYLLMTATPHKGDPENFCLFLELLDRDVYGDVKSLEAAMQKQEAPFYLRRVKEALVSFPDSETGKVKALFTKRIVRTTAFEITKDELDFYDALRDLET